MEHIINDYLTPNINQIRHSIIGIDDSYNNSWDIYAELVQNAVDAIRQSSVERGNIVLEIDCPAHSIIIRDNGVGIDKENLPYLLKPFATNKTGIDIAVGEKGVGLKFVIFSSNYFYIKTGNSSGSAEATIQDANTWKKSTDDKPLPLKFKTLEEQFSGTLVVIKCVDNENIFNLSFDQAKYVLRTKTAIGSTKPIWDDDRAIDITLKYKDINSQSFEEALPFKYWLITDIVPANSKIDLDNFEQWLGQGDRTDQEKMIKLKDKIIFRKGQFTHSNQRIIKYFACFVPVRRVWNDLSIRFQLATERNLTDDSWLSEYYYCKLNNGIYPSVKGMPTGISIDHPTTGYAGYWSNIFILFEDPFLRFDIGRKSIHGRQANIHREYAKAIFNEFLKYVTKYVSGDIVVEPTEWNRDEIFAEIERLVDLNIQGVTFKKTPTSQEASVAAIFFECIGSGKIQNIFPLISGYRSKYDLYALWDTRKVTIEFKSRLSNLARDFNDARKMFDEINCVVCWEVTDEDKQIMRNMGVNVEEITTSMFAQHRRNFPHSTHIMNLTGFTNPIYVIDLKKLLTN
jgi:hypothetical protein